MINFKNSNLKCNVYNLMNKSLHKMKLTTVNSNPINFFVFLLITILQFSLKHEMSPTLRSLSRECNEPNETIVWCGTFPDGCETTKGDYPCEMITTVRKFDLPCIKSNLQDPYIRALCAKRFSTFLVTMFRTVPPFLEGRSCANDYLDTDHSCVSREFVAVAFNKAASSAVEDEDFFYVCTAEELHVTSWTLKGMDMVPKWVRPEKDYLLPFQTKILPNSGIGVYWESIGKLRRSDADFICQFILSVEDIDMEYNGTSATSGTSESKRLDLFLDKPVNVKMVQGIVTRFNETLNYEVESVGLDGSVPNPPPPGPQVDPDHKFAAFGKPLDLSILMPSDLHNHDVRHTAEALKNDEKLHNQHWEPIFTSCQQGRSMCFVLDDDPKCQRPDEESCDLLVALEFLNGSNYKKIKVDMIVEGYPWGGFSFSKDRFMGNEIGFYCQDTYDTVTIRSLLHIAHSAEPGNDTGFDDLIEVKKNVSKIGVEKRVCSWTMKTKVNVTQSPLNPNNSVGFDLIKEEYFVLLAAGNNQQQAVAYHRRLAIMKSKFSKKIYDESVNGVGHLNKSFFCSGVVVGWVILVTFGVMSGSILK